MTRTRQEIEDLAELMGCDPDNVFDEEDSAASILDHTKMPELEYKPQTPRGVRWQAGTKRGTKLRYFGRNSGQLRASSRAYSTAARHNLSACKAVYTGSIPVGAFREAPLSVGFSWFYHGL